VDIWDGANDEPVIYHGYTLTSKILVKDVLQAIREYAFVKSPCVFLGILHYSFVFFVRVFTKQNYYTLGLKSVQLRGWRGRSGTVGGRSPGCFFWVLPKRSIPS